MKTTFKKNPLFGVIFLITGILFLVATVLQLAIKNPAAPLTLIAALLFFVNAAWTLLTPVISMADDKILYKTNPFSPKEILFSDISDVDTSNRNYIIIIKKNKGAEKIRIDYLLKSDQIILKNVLAGLKNK